MYSMSGEVPLSEGVVLVLKSPWALAATPKRLEPCSRGLSRQPDDCSFPVVLVTFTLDRLILGPVPSIHDCKVAVVGTGASVHLSGAGRTVTVRAASRCEPTIGVAC